MNHEALAQQFVQFYYQNFSTAETRGNLAGVYAPTSTVYFNNEVLVGPEQIGQYLTERITFKQLNIQQPKVSALSTGGKVLVQASGYMKVDDSPNDLPFSHCFLLVPCENGAYVEAEIFTMIL